PHRRERCAFDAAVGQRHQPAIHLGGGVVAVERGEDLGSRGERGHVLGREEQGVVERRQGFALHALASQHLAPCPVQSRGLPGHGAGASRQQRCDGRSVGGTANYPGEGAVVGGIVLEGSVLAAQRLVLETGILVGAARRQQRGGATAGR